MTDRIDLDELETDDRDADADADEPNRGDWFWSGEGDPDAEPDRPAYDVDLGQSDDAVPRVPREHDDRPVGVPVESGGAGGGPDREQPTGGVPGDDPGGEETPATAGTGGRDARPTAGSASHGSASDPVDMTLAFTFDAIRSLANLHSALADAEQWTDFVGVVGDVDAHVINKFQRDERVDLDFFNGSGTGPGDRLAAIGETSMFYADRMVLVGVDDTERAWAEDAGWEFLPLEEAAGKAEWELE